jgi:hypothetical protein
MSSFWGFHYFELRLRLKMLMLFLNEHNWHSTKSVFLFVPLYFRFYFMLCFSILCCFLLPKLYLILRWKTLFEKCLPKMKCVTNLITFPSSKWQRMTVETWWQLIFIFVSFSSFVKIIFAIHGAFSCKEISCGFSFSSLFLSPAGTL